MDLETLPSHRQMLRLYSRTCLADRIDADAFAAVLRRHALAALDARAAATLPPDAAAAARADGDRRLVERLEPLFATALHAVGQARLQELDRLGYGHGLAFKWSVLEVTLTTVTLSAVTVKMTAMTVNVTTVTVNVTAVTVKITVMTVSITVVAAIQPHRFSESVS